jgi:Rrf2 family protein
MALQYIASQKDKVLPAKEIAEALNISFEFLSKLLQQLNKAGIITSQQGIKGGYVFAMNPDLLTVSDVITIFEGESGIIDCISNAEEEHCYRLDNCSLRKPMIKIQDQINNVLKSTSIAQLANL